MQIYFYEKYELNDSIYSMNYSVPCFNVINCDCGSSLTRADSGVQLQGVALSTAHPAGPPGDPHHLLGNNVAEEDFGQSGLVTKKGIKISLGHSSKHIISRSEHSVRGNTVEGSSRVIKSNLDGSNKGGESVIPGQGLQS